MSEPGGGPDHDSASAPSRAAEGTAAQDQVSATDEVDLSLIRWMLSLSPAERLAALQGFVDSAVGLRDGTRRA